jgi:hypothetical protein
MSRKAPPVALVVALAACGSHKPPSIDATGAWLGSLTSSQGLTVSLVLDLRQQGPALDGKIEVFSGEDSSNLGFALTGAVSDRSITLDGAFESTRTHFEADVVGEVATGGYSTEATDGSDQGEQGTWSVKRLASAGLKATTSFAVPANVSAATFDGARFLAAGSGIAGVEGDDLCSFDTAGNRLSCFGVGEMCSGSIAFDGTVFWCRRFNDDKQLRVYDATFNLVAIHGAPVMDCVLGHDPRGLWCASFTKLLRLDANAAVQQTIDLAVAGPVGLTWDGKATWIGTAFPPKLYRLQPDGTVDAAADAPALSHENEGLVAIAFDGTRLVALTAWTSPAGGGAIFSTLAP